MPVARSALANALSSGRDYFIDFTTATIENPLIAGGQWSLSADTTNFPSGGKVATMTGGVRGCVGTTGTGFNDDLSVLVGAYLPNQWAWVTVYVNGTVGSYEHEVHVNSRSTGPGNHSCYAVATVALASYQLGKWTGPFKVPGTDTGPIILRSQTALPATLVTGDRIGIVVDGPANLRRIRTIYRPAAVNAAWNVIDAGDTVVQTFLDDGTNTGSLGGNAPENRNPAADSVSTNNTAPLTSGNPGIGFDNAGANALNAGFTNFRAITTPLG